MVVVYVFCLLPGINQDVVSLIFQLHKTALELLCRYSLERNDGVSHENGPTGSIKSGEFLDELKDSASWIRLRKLCVSKPDNKLWCNCEILSVTAQKMIWPCFLPNICAKKMFRNITVSRPETQLISNADRQVMW
jgi:hypothetical protein